MSHKPGGSIRAVLTAPFLILVVVLSVAAFGIGPAVFRGSVDQMKLRLELREPLAKFRPDGLEPYLRRQRSELSAAMVDELGTNEYLSWAFEDTSIEDEQSPLRWVQVHATYYSGGRDQVPHTPDWCMKGAGYTIREASNEKINVPSIGGAIPVRVVTFEKSSIFNRDRPTVIYTFHCNGDFTETRTGVRLRVNSLTEAYFYFCKIEVSFGSQNSRPHNPTRQESVAAAQKFLDHFLPRLLHEHLPDWDARGQQETASHPNHTSSG